MFIAAEVKDVTHYQKTVKYLLVLSFKSRIVGALGEEVHDCGLKVLFINIFLASLHGEVLLFKQIFEGGCNFGDHYIEVLARKAHLPCCL